MFELADTHCHLYLDLFREDLPEILERAKNRGINRILLPGTDLESSQQAVSICEKYPNLFAAVGVHPNDALSWNASTRQALKSLAQHPKVVAVGEIGLDYYRDFAPKELQIEIFGQQLELAAELVLPVIIHNREAIQDLWPQLKKWHNQLTAANSPLARLPGVLHSFDGDISSAQTAIQSNFMIGITGPVTFKNAVQRQELIASLPLNHLLLETDSPYLSPHPFRGRRNEPERIFFIAEKVAELHQETLEYTAQITTENSNRLFHWN